MSISKKRKALVGLAAVAIGMVPTTSADAATPSVTPFATGLNGPLGVDYQYGKVYVAEGDAGNILSVNPDTGAKTVESSGYQNPASVARVGNKLVVITGGEEVPDANSVGDSTVYVTSPGGTPKVLADLKAYELANNPDGQTQFDDEGAPLDALSNPFSVIRDKRPGGYVLVADAGANAVLAIDPQGKVTTFFVPPQIKTGGCAAVPNNDPEHPGCDAVPTGISYGSDGYLYVTTLQSLVPGEGRVYAIDAYTGKIKRTITGLTAPTGVVTDKQGNVYTSEATFGAPPGEEAPPPGFDPSQVGRIVKTTPSGHMTQALVTMPVGLAINNYDNTLYASAWSIAGFLGIPDAGQLVKVKQSAFAEIPD